MEKEVTEEIDLSGFEADTNSCCVKCKEIADVSDVVAKACALYFKDVYDKRDRRLSFQRLAMTPFHNALVSGNLTFVRKCLNHLGPGSQKATEFILNALVDYQTEQCQLQGFVLKEDVPVEYNFLRRIRHSLGESSVSTILNSVQPKINRYILRQIRCNHETNQAFELPLSLAVVSDNDDLIDDMLCHGADILQTDSRGKNVVHDLVLWSRHHAESAVNKYKLLMGYLPDRNQRKILLMTENTDGQTPLDLAAVLWLPEIFQYIINTEGVYKFTVRNCAMYRHVLYDVSQYERAKNSKVSPLFHINAMDEKSVARFDACSFFQSEPIRTWIDLKLTSYKSSGLVWYMFWIIYLIFYCVQLAMYLTTGSSNIGINIVVVIFASCQLFGEVGHIKSTWAAAVQIFRRQKSPTTSTTVYRLLHLTFTFLVIITTSFEFANSDCRYMLALQGLHVFCVIMATLSNLFFLQLDDSTGYILTALQRMLKETGLFLTVSTVFYMGFSTALYILHAPQRCNDIAISENRTRTTFQTYASTMYETFLLMLTIMSPQKLYFEESYLSGIAIFVYIITLSLFSIVLLNLLIAMMGRRISEIYEHRATLHVLERLSVLFLKETSPFAKLLRNYSKFRNNSDKTEVYVEVLEVGPPRDVPINKNN